MNRDRRDYRMFDRNEFLEQYNIDGQDLKNADISWEEMTGIYENYRAMERRLRLVGKSFVDEYLYDIEKAGIHSYRYRTDRKSVV